MRTASPAPRAAGQDAGAPPGWPRRRRETRGAPARRAGNRPHTRKGSGRSTFGVRLGAAPAVVDHHRRGSADRLRRSDGGHLGYGKRAPCLCRSNGARYSGRRQGTHTPRGSSASGHLMTRALLVRRRSFALSAHGASASSRLPATLARSGKWVHHGDSPANPPCCLKPRQCTYRPEAVNWAARRYEEDEALTGLATIPVLVLEIALIPLGSRSVTA